MYKERVVQAGNTMEVSRYHDWDHTCVRSSPRKKKTGETPESVKRANSRNIIKNLRRLLNTNFKDGDSFVTLTYNDITRPCSISEESRDMASFLRRLRSVTRKAGITLKYVYTLELDSENKLHVHMVINLPASSELLKLYWQMGFVHAEALYGNGQYSGLAQYMLKDANNTRLYALNNEGKHIQAYTRSHNLNNPEIHDEVITERDVLNPYDQIDGYCIEKDSEYFGISDDGYLYSTCSYIRL